MTFKWFLSRNRKDIKLAKAIKAITGYYPTNLSIFKLAFRHSSAAKKTIKGFRLSNERLEFLGDAILGAIVADFVFKKFPYKSEGFMTELRSKIVNRESLNNLADKLGITYLIQFSGNIPHTNAYKSMPGDAMEAFVGAMYLDMGFKKCKRFVIKQILQTHYDIEKLIDTTVNFKSSVIEWSQKNNKILTFDIIDEKENNTNSRTFIAQVSLDNIPICTGKGLSKKKAEQAAAKNACEILKIQ